ncbi:ABTB1-like protein [Mya arenaria]|uniref:ABTB1-like protein n=1 Tax=Mya arenaria TaxID=6604 RepID=A0ABY7FWX5_MYAAR|nr:ABTB1-like protein [Mya arenaria]
MASLYHGVILHEPERREPSNVSVCPSVQEQALVTVRHLVENKDVGINIRDKWDSTPLYYACLCGHEELVKYLLENDYKSQECTRTLFSISVVRDSELTGVYSVLGANIT